jgi:cytochrome c-type biogenesis protein
VLALDPVSAAGISFLAGLLAPLGAVCVLPLYPGYLAWLANQVGEGNDRTLLFRFSLVVTAGLIFAFLVIGFIVTWLLRSSVSAVIGVISLIAFVILAGVSICLIAGIDLSRIFPSPKMLHPVGPYQNALVFGLFFGLIILPCNPGPIILLFALSVNAADFLENIVILIAFCIGIAIPVLLISLIPAATNYRLVRVLTTHRRLINIACGLFMLVLALYYLVGVFHLPELLDTLMINFTGKF